MDNLSFYIINGIAEIYVLFRYFRAFLGESRIPIRRMVVISAVYGLLFVLVNTMGEPIVNLVASLGLMVGISLF